MVHNATSDYDDLPLEDLEDLMQEIIQDPYAIKIAQGHAYDFHKNDFPQVTNRFDLAKQIEYIISNPTASRELSGGRSAYLDEPNQIVVIVNPRDPDGGTAYRPRNSVTQEPTDARDYFNDLD